MADREITFEIKKHLGILSTNDNGWQREVNIVSWNGMAPKYDIREWNQEHTKMSKGITLFADEMQNLADLYIKDQNKDMVSKRK